MSCVYVTACVCLCVYLIKASKVLVEEVVKHTRSQSLFQTQSGEGEEAEEAEIAQSLTAEQKRHYQYSV